MEKRTSLFENGLIWFGAGVSIAEILTGTYFAALGFGRGLAAILVGHVIGCIMLFLAGVIGGKTRKSAMETVKDSFGSHGGQLFAILNVLQLVGWTAIMIYDGALAAGGIFTVGHWVWCGAAVELAVAMPLSWLPLISDYTREAKEPVKATAVSTVVYGVVSCFMYLVGMGAALFTGESDIAQIMVKAGLGIAGLLIIVFSTVTTTFLDAYSAGISSESIFAGLKGKYVAVVVTVIGTIGAIVYPMDDITDFLYLIGSVFAPMIAVQIADFFILKKKKSETGFDWCNLLIWLAGFILYRVLMNIDMLLGNTLPDMVLTILLCMIVAAVRGRKKA